MKRSPLLVVGSGRSGTHLLANFFATQESYAAHHEYVVNHTQVLGTKRFLEVLTENEATEQLDRLHGAAIRLAKIGTTWGDSSNKLSWLLREFSAIFPDVRVLHIVRDGRKVAGSYARKLRGEHYAFNDVRALCEWLDGEGEEPPPEKKYWWPVPKDEEARKQFLRMSVLQRSAWHWVMSNREIEKGVLGLQPGNSLRLRLEDLVSQREARCRAADFCELPHSVFEDFDWVRPQNVHEPTDKVLSGEELSELIPIAGEDLNRYGYTEEEARMVY